MFGIFQLHFGIPFTYDAVTGSLAMINLRNTDYLQWLEVLSGIVVVNTFFPLISLILLSKLPV